jgi:hypothetical protein
MGIPQLLDGLFHGKSQSKLDDLGGSFTLGYHHISVSFNILIEFQYTNGSC